MVHRFICVFLLCTSLATAQSLDGKWQIRLGGQFNLINNIDEPDRGAAYNRLRSRPGIQAEINYVYWRKDGHELFGGLRHQWFYYFQRTLVSFSDRALLGYSRTNFSYGFLNSTALVAGYRHWFEQAGQVNYAWEASVLGSYNHFYSHNRGYELDVNPITPAIRLGNIIQRNKFIFSLSLSWNPLPEFKRNYSWHVTESAKREAESGRGSSTHGMLQFGMVVGMRL